MDNLGSKIRKYRKRASLSQFELELEIEAAHGSASRVENGLVNPTKETLQKISKALDLSSTEIADLFNILVSPNHVDNVLLAYSNIFPDVDCNRMWIQGELHDLYTRLFKHYDSLNNFSLLGLASVTLELGKFGETVEILDYLRSVSKKEEDLEILQYMNLLESELNIINDEFSLAHQKIMAVIEYAFPKKNSYLLGKSHFLLGLINSQTKNSLEGVKNIRKSMDYFDIIRYPLDLGKSYLFMTDFLEYDEAYTKATDFYSRAYEIFDRVGNSYYQGWCLGGNAFSNYVQGNLKEAITLSKKAKKLDKEIGSVKQLYYSTSVLAKTLLVSGNLPESLKHLDHALQLERQFRRSVDLSSTNLYILFIKSQQSRDKLISLEQSIGRLNHNDETKSYIMRAAQYLHGFDRKKILEGEKGLLELRDQASYPHLIKTIDLTLQNKSIQPATL